MNTKKPSREVIQAVVTLYAEHTEDLTLVEHDGSGGFPRMAIVVAREPRAIRELVRFYNATCNGHPLPFPLPDLGQGGRS